MAKAIIKLVYRHVIDERSVTDFEKQIFHASYDEFLMRSQAYNMDGKFKTFDQIRANDGRANSLHYKLAIAVTHFIDRLEHKIPRLEDQLGDSLLFEVPEFKLIASDVADKSLHKVQISYITGGLTLLSTIGDHLVIATGDQTKNTGPITTFTIKLTPGLSVYEYQEV